MEKPEVVEYIKNRLISTAKALDCLESDDYGYSKRTHAEIQSIREQYRVAVFEAKRVGLDVAELTKGYLS